MARRAGLSFDVSRRHEFFHNLRARAKFAPDPVTIFVRPADGELSESIRLTGEPFAVLIASRL